MSKVVLGNEQVSITIESDGNRDLGTFSALVVDGKAQRQWELVAVDPFLHAAVCTDSLRGIDERMLGISLSGLEWQLVGRSEWTLVLRVGETTGPENTPVTVILEAQKDGMPISNRAGDVSRETKHEWTFNSTIGQLKQFARGIQTMLAEWGVD